MSIHSTNAKIDFGSIKQVCYLVANVEVQDEKGEWHIVPAQVEITASYDSFYYNMYQLLYDLVHQAIGKIGIDEESIGAKVLKIETNIPFQPSVQPENIYENINHLGKE